MPDSGRSRDIPAAAGIGDEPWIVEKTAEIERVLVRDELYRREIRDRVTVSHADIRTGLGRYGRLVTLVALAARSREDASRLSSALSHRHRLRGETAASWNP